MYIDTYYIHILYPYIRLAAARPPSVSRRWYHIYMLGIVLVEGLGHRGGFRLQPLNRMDGWTNGSVLEVTEQKKKFVHPNSC